ncbi:MAG: hypothetical protein AVDCRST_MAG27-4520 [uncultured Craurococcus sp.]|uniref:Uncharacterized protein n=1 Tax=uncultured Craurococcus sp. TaxID=1135998 RepID=A0A6J4JVP8_9PROT|nr:MAG: hypothetical protein AVDCRST_MAG27-4520 [uncultured Craurococcus sp.]
MDGAAARHRDASRDKRRGARGGDDRTLLDLAGTSFFNGRKIASNHAVGIVIALDFGRHNDRLAVAPEVLARVAAVEGGQVDLAPILARCAAEGLSVEEAGTLPTRGAHPRRCDGRNNAPWRRDHRARRQLRPAPRCRRRRAEGRGGAVAPLARSNPAFRPGFGPCPAATGHGGGRDLAAPNGIARCQRGQPPHRLTVGIWNEIPRGG